MTDQPKWTPGPWAYAPDGIIYLADDDVEPTIAAVDFSNTDQDQAAADGNLIAAAPDLYAALETLSALNDDHGPFGGEIYQDRVDRAWSSARAALAKARGEAK